MKHRSWMTFVAACSSIAAQTCTIPAQAPATRDTRVDFRNPAMTDYYALSLSWSPAFCAQSGGAARSRFQCVDNSFGFVVHGLWAQSAAARGNRDHPRFCKMPEVLPGSLTRRYMCIMPDAQLIQDEWNKHGSCGF